MQICGNGRNRALLIFAYKDWLGGLAAGEGCAGKSARKSEMSQSVAAGLQVADCTGRLLPRTSGCAGTRDMKLLLPEKETSGFD